MDTYHLPVRVSYVNARIGLCSYVYTSVILESKLAVIGDAHAHIPPSRYSLVPRLFLIMKEPCNITSGLNEERRKKKEERITKMALCYRTLFCVTVFHVAFGHLYGSC